MQRRRRYSASGPAPLDAAASASWANRLLALPRRLHHFKTEHQFLGRYSVEKLHAFHDYQAHVAWWRVAFVLLATPLPTVLVLLAMDAVPMDDPRAGAAHNVVCFVRSIVSHGVMTSACLLPARQALRLNESGKYSIAKVALLGLLTCVMIESVWIPLAFLWRFPVPFRELLGAPLWCIVVVFLHAWLTPGVFTRRQRRTRIYLVVVGSQIAILYGFLALSMVFAHVPLVVQVLMIALCPLVKVVAKRFVWKYARQLDDISTDVTICIVEISGSLYQTVCLQFAASKAIAAVIMVTDLVQGIIEVRAYLATQYLVDGRATLATAMAILQSSIYPGADERPSLVHNSSTTSQADPPSASRRHSGNGSLGPVIPRHRQRRPSVSSVFMQPKQIRTHASKRLMDLWKSEFDALDRGVGAEGDMDDPGEIERKNSSLYETDHQRSIVSRDVDLMLVEPDATNSHNTPNVPRLRPSGPLRKIVRTEFLEDNPGISGSPPPESLVVKSVSSSSQSATAHGGLLLMARQISNRLILYRRRSSNSTLPLDSDHVAPIEPTLQSRNSLTRVLPEVVGHVNTSRESATPAISSARSTAPPTVRHSSFPAMRPQSSSSTTHAPAAASIERRRRNSGGSGSSPVTIDGVQVARKDQARILEQTLQLLFSCEVLLFVEYMEVVMPVLYAMCLGTEWALPNGKYNLITMDMTRWNLESTLISSVVYAMLELLSLIVLNYIVWRKYGISAFHLLAFVLETYSLTLQGKLVGAFIVIINTATIHQGVDFSFLFDYDALLRRSQNPSR